MPARKIQNSLSFHVQKYDTTIIITPTLSLPLVKRLVCLCGHQISYDTQAGQRYGINYGLEYAQAVLGHSSARTIEIYAKASFEKAAKVAREIG
jgi:hypothetical protein